jgi:hypothetical protein
LRIKGPLAIVQNDNDKYGRCSLPGENFLFFSMYTFLSLFSTFLGVNRISPVILPLRFKHNFCIACSYLATHRSNYLGIFWGVGVIFCSFGVLFFLRVCFLLLACLYLVAVQKIIDVSKFNSAFIFKSKHFNGQVFFAFLCLLYTKDEDMTFGQNFSDFTNQHGITSQKTSAAK